MVARIHDTYYDAKATLLSEADIKEIRESRGRIPNATQKMASKFHIGPKRVYEIWDNKERLQQGVVPEGTQPIQTSKKDINNVNLDASYEKMVEKSTKIVDEKKKRYTENNSPIP
uniref:Uncharacterized protein n=1 Tax=Rhizophagus irregularis (strain DAOM 181602 / DAOM 197198 / MUCL 43194) TaxID=747089 RepID=U9URU8_RHIID